MTSFALVALFLIHAAEPAGAEEKRHRFCGTSASRGELALAAHELFQQQHRLRTTEASVSQAGNVVLMEADTQLVQPANPFNLHGVSLVFDPSPSGGYVVSKQSSILDLNLGRDRRLGDDDSLALNLPFPFQFFGTERRNLFLNSNGNLTFQSERPVEHPSANVFVEGPPRIAGLFNDLNPEAGGTIRVAEQPERVVVTWNAVPEWNTNNQNTFQIELQPNGRITLRYADRIDVTSGIVGLASGDSGGRAWVVDFSGPGGRVDATFFERFYPDPVVDQVAIVKRFYQNYQDVFDAIIIWTNFRSDLDDAFAFRIRVSNNVRGIGAGIYDRTSRWGSAGQLKGVVFMGNLERYPRSLDDPIYRGGLDTLSLLAHEVSHRWLAFAGIQDGNAPRNALMGRGDAHWSFFMDSDSSFLEGNDFEQESNNRFRSIDIESRYSMLDLYLMGLAGPEEVIPFFYIADGSGTSRTGQAFTNESRPELGAVVRGTKRDVRIDAIIRAEGPRVPDVNSSPKHFRQAWVILSQPDNPSSPDQIGRVDHIRNAWEGYFQRHTLGRGTVYSSLGQ